MAVLSCGIVPVDIRPEPKYLLLRAYSYWDFPKGKCEAGEDAIETAFREAREEAGLVDIRLFENNVYKETLPYTKKKKIARYYLTESLSPEQVKITPNPETGKVEHHEFRWCTYAEASELVGERLGLILDWAHEQVTNENV
jgi:bis(5'-nucleosidyl)-tetraphosphatase